MRSDLRLGRSRALGGLLGLGLTFLTVQAADAATYTVPSSQCPAGPTAIQDCIDNPAVQDGDTIVIREKKGSQKPNDAYYENVVVTKDLTITGVDCRKADAVVIDAAPSGDPGGIGFDIEAEGVTIQCLKIRHGQVGIRDLGYDNLRVSNVTVTGQRNDDLYDAAGGDSIYLDGVDDYVVELSRMSHAMGDGLEVNTDLGTSNNGRVLRNQANNLADCFELNGNDILVDRNTARDCDDEGFDIEGNNPRVLNNNASDVDQDGFEINCSVVCTGARITGNTSRGNGDDGFQIQFFDWDNITWADADGAQIVENRAERNIQDGMELLMRGVLIRGNRIDGNGSNDHWDFGMEIDGDGNTIENNISNANTRDGFNIEGNNNILRNNKADKNRKDGFDIEEYDFFGSTSTGNVLIGNEARNNEGEGFENNGADTVLNKNKANGNRINCASDGTIHPASGSNNFSIAECGSSSPEIESKPDSQRRRGEE